MAYLGNAPARSFISFERQVFTIVNSQTAYALSHSVTNENDIRLVVNNVVQEPGSGKAYTATGTALTLSAALTNGTDEMYCVFLGRAVGTVNAPAGSVTSSTLASDINISTTGTVTTAGLITDSITKTGDLTVDVSGNIRLDAADNGEVRLLDGGTQYGVLKDDSQRLKIQGTVSDKDILFAVNDGGSETTALTLDASEAGLAIFNAGVAIGGTGSANTLDDYEEGSWTPAVTQGSLGDAYGYYTKIGDVVNFTMITGIYSDTSSSSHGVQLTLPFTSQNENNKQTHCVVMSRYLSISNVSLTGYINQNTNKIEIFKNGNNSNNWSNLLHSELDSSSSYLRISGFFYAN